MDCRVRQDSRPTVKSRHLQLLATEYGDVIYNSLWPSPLKIGEGILELLDIIDSGAVITSAQSSRLAGLLRALYQHKVVFYTQSEEKEFLQGQHEEWMEKAFGGTLLRTLILNIDTRCNMLCTYCNVLKAQSEGYLGEPSPMNWSIARYCIDQFISISKQRGIPWAKIVLFGGEPLLNRDVLVRTVKYICSQNSEKRLFLSVNTNGLLMDKALAEILRDTDCTVALSIDGPATVHNINRRDTQGNPTFASAIRCLELVTEVGCRVAVLTTLGAESFSYLDEFRGMLSRFGVQHWALKLPTFEEPSSPIYNSERIPDWAYTLVRVIRRASESGMSVSGLPEAKFAGCEGVGRMICVEPNGDIYPCPGGIRLRLGSFDQMDGIFEGDAYRYVAGRTLAALRECQSCPVGGFCAGGCAADAEYRSGHVYARNPLICRFQREFVRATLSVRLEQLDSGGNTNGSEVLPSCTV